MINRNLFLKDNINSKNLRGFLFKNLSKKFDKILTKIKDDIRNSKQTLNVLNKNFKFNFKKKDLQKFNKFQNIALIGMGGSILGSEAIYYFLQSKIKKKLTFSMT